MASKSKSKGSSWERTIADSLTELYGEQFLRVPNSGAFLGGSNFHRKGKLDEGQVKTFKGDIIPPTSWTKFNCEAKNYNDFPFHQLFSGEVKQLETWLNQLMDSANGGDFSLLLVKITRKATLVAFKWHSTLRCDKSFSYQSTSHGTWNIMDFNLFWSLNKDAVKNLCSN